MIGNMAPGGNGRDYDGINRPLEMTRVREEERDAWLAGEIDGVERRFLRNQRRLERSSDRLADELRKTREEMHLNANKVLYAALTGAFALVVGVVIAVTLGG